MKNMQSWVVPVIVLFMVSCSAPGRREAYGDDFNTLLAESKRYMEYSPDSALAILRELLLRPPGEEEDAGRGWALNYTGVGYDIKGMYDSAAYYLYEASRLAERTKNDSLSITVYTNLGVLQFEMNNADEALNYYRHALALAGQRKDSVSMARLLNNIGNSYMSLSNDFQAAVPYFERSREIGAKIGFSSALRVAGINLAMIYNETNEPDKAIEEAQMLIDLYGPNVYADFTIAQAFHQKKEYREAIRRYQEALEGSMDTKELELAILKAMADVYRLSGEPGNAIGYIERYHAQKDSLHKLQIENEISKLKIAYETEKKETQISVLEEERKLMTLLGASGAVVLLLTLGVFVFLWRWTVQKRRVAEQQRQLAQQQVSQLEQEKQLIATQAVLDGEVQERTRLARDLHDGLGGMLIGMKLNLESLKEGVMPGSSKIKYFDKAMKILNDSMAEMRRIAHHLMPDTLDRCGLNAALKDFCDSFPAVEYDWTGSDASLGDRQMEVMIYRIIHELVNNAMKHSGATKIGVNVMRGDDYIALTVHDNGCGFDKTRQTRGTGLRNIRERVASRNGRMELDTEAGKGTEVNVEFECGNDDRPHSIIREQP